MKKYLLFLIMISLLITQMGLTTAAVAESVYPVIPQVDRKHYIIYKEGYRSGRVEVCLFNIVNDDATQNIVWNRSIELKDNSKYKDGTKYYQKDNAWVQFEYNYPRISDYGITIMESDLDVRDKSGNLVLAGMAQVSSDVPATKIALDKTSLSLNVNQNAKLTATLTPTNSTSTVSWSSDKPTIVWLIKAVSLIRKRRGQPSSPRERAVVLRRNAA